MLEGLIQCDEATHGTIWDPKVDHSICEPNVGGCDPFGCNKITSVDNPPLSFLELLGGGIHISPSQARAAQLSQVGIYRVHGLESFGFICGV